MIDNHDSGRAEIRNYQLLNNEIFPNLGQQKDES